MCNVQDVMSLHLSLNRFLYKAVCISSQVQFVECSFLSRCVYGPGQCMPLSQYWVLQMHAQSD